MKNQPFIREDALKNKRDLRPRPMKREREFTKDNINATTIKILKLKFPKIKKQAITAKKKELNNLN